MKFEFSYEKLLHHKATLEDLARREYLLAQQAVDLANRAVEEMYSAIDAARSQAFAQQSKGNANAAAGVSADEFIRGQNIRIERKRQEIRSLMNAAEEKHQLLIEASKEKKTLEKLKERRYKQFLRARKKLELKEIDEVVTTRFKRGAA